MSDTPRPAFVPDHEYEELRSANIAASIDAVNTRRHEGNRLVVPPTTLREHDARERHLSIARHPTGGSALAQWLLERDDEPNKADVAAELRAIADRLDPPVTTKPDGRRIS